MSVLVFIAEVGAGTTLTEIAQATEIPKSTTSNLLRTMVEEGILTYSSETRRYDLGPILIEVGAAALRRNTPLMAALPRMRQLASDTGLACLAIQRMPDGHFVAVEKVESTQDIKVTIEIGERFPPHAPLLSRLWAAWDPESDLPTQSLPQTTEADGSQLLATIRRQGYIAVFGEYVPNLNVIGVPIFGRDSKPRLAITILGFGEHLRRERVSELAPKMVKLSRRVTVETGGTFPSKYLS